MIETLRLVLASASPRRRELLAEVGLDVAVIASDLDEASETLPPEPARAAEHLALAKARSVATSHLRDVVIGADTIVVDRGIALGKPADEDEARQMLAGLRDREHHVITGVAVILADRSTVTHALTRVRMRDYGEQEVSAYVAGGEPFDKAGAYAIQDPQFRPVAAWHGCYCNVVGLPLALTLKLVAGVAPQLVPAEPRFPGQCGHCPYVRTAAPTDP